jgi:hypothetical protein
MPVAQDQRISRGRIVFRLEIVDVSLRGEAEIE